MLPLHAEATTLVRRNTSRAAMLLKCASTTGMRIADTASAIAYE